MKGTLLAIIATLTYLLGFIAGSGNQIKKQEKRNQRRRAFNQERATK